MGSGERGRGIWHGKWDLGVGGGGWGLGPGAPLQVMADEARAAYR